MIYTVPSFQNPAGETMSLERRRRLVEIARERELLVARGQPVRAPSLRGRSAPDPVRARRRRLRRLPRHVLEDPLPRPPPRLALRAAARAREGRARQAGVRPLHLDARAVLRRRVLRRGPLARVRGRALRRLPRRAATRCWSRSSSTSPPRRPGPSPRAACSCGRRSPTSSTPPTSSPARFATTSRSSPASRRSPTGVTGKNSMRLNFSGSTEDEIREGIRRIGAVVAEQVALYGAITREQRRGARPTVPGTEPRPAAADVRAHAPARSPRREGRGSQGWAVARAAGVASLGRAGRGCARREPRGRLARRGARPGRAAQGRAARRRVRRAPRRRRRGRHRPGAARDPRHPLHRPGRLVVPALDRQGRGQAGASRARDRDARLGLVLADRVLRARRRRRAGGDRGAARLSRSSSSPRAAARRWASASPRRATTCRRRSSRRSPTTAACSWSATSTGRELSVGMLEGEALPAVEIRPRDEDRYSYEARYEIGRTDFICPAELGDDEAAVRETPPSRPGRRSTAPASSAST